MKMHNTLTLAFAAAILIATYAKADFVTLYTDKDTYMSLAGASEWALVGVSDFDKAKAPYEGDFTLKHTVDPNKSIVNGGHYILDKYNGMGAGYTHALSGEGCEVGMQFSHNSANVACISTPGGLIHSFYLNVGTHSEGTTGLYDITFYDADGNVEVAFSNLPFGWAGFIFDEGLYLDSFTITSKSTNNTGFYFDFVPGNGHAAVPEPATLIITGLGIAGLALARRRTSHKKRAPNV